MLESIFRQVLFSIGICMRINAPHIHPQSSVLRLTMRSATTCIILSYITGMLTAQDLIYGSYSGLHVSDPRGTYLFKK